MITKHQLILNYIENIPIGDKLSVRKIARQLKVSEGTAYRAIKEAENQGLVRSIERVGTIRTEPMKKSRIESLTFEQILNIIDGETFGGTDGLHRTFRKFVIGAMQVDAMKRYISEGSLVIVGNRSDAQKLSLELGAAVLITGGFGADKEIIQLANELNLPLLSTTYDTFTVATMINQALTDQLIEKEILQIKDILTSMDQTYYLNDGDTIEDYQLLNQRTKHSRFPVVNSNRQVIGIISPKDVIGQTKDICIRQVMTSTPVTISETASVANASHKMIWDGYELLPVTDEMNSLRGVVSRQDVMKAMQSSRQHIQALDTISDQITKAVLEDDGVYNFQVTPALINSTGSLAIGVMAEVLTYVAQETVVKASNMHIMIEQINIQNLKLIELDTHLKIVPKIYNQSRRKIHLDVQVYCEEQLVAKALLTCQAFHS